MSDWCDMSTYRRFFKWTSTLWKIFLALNFLYWLSCAHHNMHPICASCFWSFVCSLLRALLWGRHIIVFMYFYNFLRLMILYVLMFCIIMTLLSLCDVSIVSYFSTVHMSSSTYISIFGYQNNVWEIQTCFNWQKKKKIFVIHNVNVLLSKKRLKIL